MKYSLKVQFWYSLSGVGVFETQPLRLNKLNSVPHHCYCSSLHQQVWYWHYH